MNQSFDGAKIVIPFVFFIISLGKIKPHCLTRIGSYNKIQGEKSELDKNLPLITRNSARANVKSLMDL